MEKKDAVILAAGTFPTSPQALACLDNATFLCCCDSAVLQLMDYGRMPDAVVGDGDSLSPEQISQLGELYHHVTEQEYNDLTKATRYCKSLGYTDITYLGCTGKREDHTLGNISLMDFYRREMGINATMVTDSGTFTTHHGDVTMPSFPRQQVSIFNLSCRNLSSERLKWPAYAYTQLWQGTLNEALADAFTIHADGDYMLYLTHEEKK